MNPHTAAPPGHTYRIGHALLSPIIEDGQLRSLGRVTVRDTDLRLPEATFLPWFDSYDHGVMGPLLWRGVVREQERLIIKLTAVLTSDYPFIERRDVSGDVCLRQQRWDAAPVEADLRIVFEPAEQCVDGVAFEGFRYWFEYACDDVPIHRLMDRQTWELDGTLDDVTIVCRNLFDLPRKRVDVAGSYSTVGLGRKSNRLLPGNLWARWSLLPAFDMQYGSSGTMLAWFDQVSCIRTVVESLPDEDVIRYTDLHYFEQSHRVQTNPKTVLFNKQQLDDVDALNLWTRVHDQEHHKALHQFGIESEPPAGVTLGHNVWQNMHFDHTYDEVVKIASEFGAEYVFIDSVFEHLEAYRRASLPHTADSADPILKKHLPGHMCRTLDFEVAKALGGEEGLANLCQRAADQGVKIFSWMSAHLDPQTYLKHRDMQDELGAGSFGIFAAKESGRHPDSGYASDCWTLNLNTPIMEKLRDQLLGVCRRTGLAGFLWDSFSNLGWWQVDYSTGTMRPQYDRMCELYAALVNEGLYIQPEAIVSFTSHSACGLFGGNVYAGDLLGYSYNTVIGLHYSDEPEGNVQDHGEAVLRGEEPFDLVFRCFAHKRIVSVPANHVPREEWHPQAVQQVKQLFKTYRQYRHLMVHRTVLKNDRGVKWTDDNGHELLFSFQSASADGQAIDLSSDSQPTVTQLEPCHVYLLQSSE